MDPKDPPTWKPAETPGGAPPNAANQGPAAGSRPAAGTQAPSAGSWPPPAPGSWPPPAGPPSGGYPAPGPPGPSGPPTSWPAPAGPPAPAAQRHRYPYANQPFPPQPYGGNQPGGSRPYGPSGQQQGGNQPYGGSGQPQGGAGQPPYGGPQYATPPYGSQPYGGVPYGGYPDAPGGTYGAGGPYGGDYGNWDQWRNQWNVPAPAQPTSKPWIALGVALAIIVAAVLGFGLVSRVHNNGTNNNALGGTNNPYYSGTSANPALGNQVAAKLDPGVVDINTVLDFGAGEAAGTGIILSSSGEVLTNNHVVEDATSIQVTVVTTGRTYTGTVVGWDLNDDVAVVQMQGASGLSPAALGDSAKVAVHDEVVAIGNALGQGGTPSVAEGSVVALNQSITASDSSAHSQEDLSGLIETNANLEPGDSGGPLANASGQVIGMDTAASTSYQFESAGSSYAIPINTALSIARQIESGQNSGNVHNGFPGFLGVDVSDTGGNGNGALVTGVLPNTAASSAGIQQGDLVTSAAGQSISDAADLTTVMGKQKPGAHVMVQWTDSNGQSHSSSVTLTKGPVP